MRSDVPEQLDRLVHALRQPLGAARLLADDLAHASQPSHRALALRLLDDAIGEAIEVAHALADLAERARHDSEGSTQDERDC